MRRRTADAAPYLLARMTEPVGPSCQTLAGLKADIPKPSSDSIGVVGQGLLVRAIRIRKITFWLIWANQPSPGRRRPRSTTEDTLQYVLFTPPSPPSLTRTPPHDNGGTGPSNG